MKKIYIGIVLTSLSGTCSPTRKKVLCSRYCPLSSLFVANLNF